MSDFPFDVPTRVPSNNVTGVEYEGTTLTLTRADESTLTTTIETSAGDAVLAGNNAFTGANTFNSSRPTSTLEGTIEDNDFITRRNANTLYSNNAGDVTQSGNNTYTGANAFNTTRPTSDLTSTPGNDDFITRRNADALYTDNVGDVTKAGGNAFTGANTFNTTRPTSDITSTPGNDDFITRRNADALYTDNVGDVTQSGNNTYTGSNAFNTTRPTSDLTSTPGNDDFITRRNADALYTDNVGDVTQSGNNTYTGANTYNTTRPTSTITNASSAPNDNDFITKDNADDLYLAGSNTFSGNNAFTGANTFNNTRPTSTLTDDPADTAFITRQNANILYVTPVIGGFAQKQGINTFDEPNTFETSSTKSCIRAINTTSGTGNFFQNFTGSGAAGYGFGSPELGIAQFRTKQGAYQPIISVMNSDTGAVSTSKQATIGFYATDNGNGNGKFMGSVGFHPTNQDVTKNDFRINQVINDLQQPTDVFKITEDVQTRFDFKGQGQYPTIRLKGTSDNTECLELGRNNANGDGYLKLGDNGLIDGAGILLRGNDFSHINGGNLGIGIGTSTPSEKLEVNGNVKTINGQFIISNGYATTFTQTSHNVVNGNPTDAEAASNTKGGSLYSQLNASITTKLANQKVLITCVVNGEWSSEEENKGLILMRATTGNGVPIRPAASGSRGRIISPFTNSYHQNYGSTLETSVVHYVDLLGTADTYTYFPMLINSGSASHTFYFNRAAGGTDQGHFEIAGSSMSLQLLSV